MKTIEEKAYKYAASKKATKFTVGEIAKHYKDGYSDGQKNAIEKACEWLNDRLPLYSGLNADNTDRFVFLFKKAMEEQQ